MTAAAAALVEGRPAAASVVGVAAAPALLFLCCRCYESQRAARCAEETDPWQGCCLSSKREIHDSAAVAAAAAAHAGFCWVTALWQGCCLLNELATGAAAGLCLAIQPSCVLWVTLLAPPAQ
jgi:hypothetical protein